MDATGIYFTFMGFFIFFVLILILIGIFFLIRGIQKHLDNLIVGAIGFLSLSIGFIGYIGFNMGEIFQEVCVFICLNATIVFTNLTFYKNRKKRKKLIILVITIILGLIQIAFFILAVYYDINLYYLRVSFDIPYNIVPFHWMAYSSWKAYLKFKKLDIQPWIKLRYKLNAIFSVIISFNNIPEFFQPEGVNWGDPTNPISLSVFGIMAILALIFAFGFGLAWLMPGWLKHKINRNYIEEDELDMSEEELMNIIANQLRPDKE